MKKTIEYHGKNYSAWVSEWSCGETTATIKIGRNEVLLVWSRYGWVKNV